MYYTTVVADCPWQYKDALKMSDGVARSSSSQYATMGLDKVKTFLHDTPATVVQGDIPYDPYQNNLEVLIKPDAFLWLWITNPFLLDGSGAAVCKAWGFEPKALMTWTKGRLKTADDRVFGPTIIERPGMGRYTRGVTEHLILATRGKVGHLVQAKNVTNWFLAPRGAHSVKPEEAYRRVKRVTPGPYLALFERTYRDGFDVVGDELPALPVQEQAA